MMWVASIIGAVALLLALNRYTLWRAGRAEALYPPMGRFVEVEGVRLHYVRKGYGRTVVLLHGSDGFLQDFTSTIDLLARHYDVIAFDRPGHGYSGIPAGETLSSIVQARLIRSALRQLDVATPLLVGHSWSGSLLMVYGLEYPDEAAGLVLLGGWVYASERPYPLFRIPQIFLLGGFLSSTLLILVRGWLIRWNLRKAFWPDRVPQEYARLALALWQRRPWQTRVFAQENTADRAVLLALQPRYAHLKTPLVIVTGDRDRVVDPDRHARRLHAEITASALMVLPGAGHEVPQTCPAAVVEAVQQGWHLADARQPHEMARTNSTSAPHAVAREGPLRARDLVFRYGWNATAYQILSPGIRHWFSSDGNAVIGYVTRHRVRVVAGAPICDASRLSIVMVEFEQASALEGESVCYFAVETRLFEALSRLAVHSAILIGAQPVWDPTRWPDLLSHHASLRAQVNRARNKGMTVSEWPANRAHGHPALQRCLDEWLQSRPLPPMRFLTASVSLDHLADRRLFVAEIAGNPMGFLVLTPVPDRDGWLAEQIVRGRSAPNGTAEMLIDAMMRAAAEEGSHYVTLGLAPLSRRVPPPASARFSCQHLLLAWVREHGRRFYNFDGLDAFKGKFYPYAWQPLYAISTEPRFSTRTLYATASAFSEGPLFIAIGRAMLAAARQEAIWFRERHDARTSR